MPERPEHFEGTVTLEWVPGPAPMRGWRFMPRAEDGTPITTATELTIHASAQDIVWAEMTMFTDAAGRPDSAPHVGDDREILTGTFAFEVAGMSVTEQPGA